MTPEARERQRIRNRNYYLANAERIKERQKKYNKTKAAEIAVDRRRRRRFGSEAEYDRYLRAQFSARVDPIKLERGCEFVGPNGERCTLVVLHAVMLHFDHRDPRLKKFDIAKGARRAWGEVEAEIAKCDVLCAAHHSWKTYIQFDNRRRIHRQPMLDPQLSLFQESA